MQIACGVIYSRILNTSYFTKQGIFFKLDSHQSDSAKDNEKFVVMSGI